MLAQELLKVGHRHIDAVPGNGRSCSEDEKTDVRLGRSAILDQAHHEHVRAEPRWAKRRRGLAGSTSSGVAPMKAAGLSNGDG